MSVTINQFLQGMNNIAPEMLAEKWDNGGVQIDSGNEKIQKILVCMELTDEIVKEAIEKKADMMMTHHPFIFSPIKNIGKDWTGINIVKLIQNNISVYSSHTSFDSVIGGNNDYLAKLLNIGELSAIKEQKYEKYFKVVVYVPKEAIEPVRNSFFNSGAGNINDYSHCTFCFEGVGTFLPLDDANPYIGERNEVTYVNEYRLESIVSESKLEKVIEEMLKAHPYEEPAYDIFLMENAIVDLPGLGRLGELDEATTLENICTKIKKVLEIKNNIFFVGDKTKGIKKIAICTGSGADLIRKVYDRGCELLITGDIKYHDAQQAKQLGIALIDASHFHTEKIFVQNMSQQLRDTFNGEVDIIESKIDINPFQFI